MLKLYDDLYQTNVEHPFDGLNTHAYLLLRNEGNVLFYNTSNSESIQDIFEKGGIIYQYLSHRHETGVSLPKIKKLFGSQLCADTVESKYIFNTCIVDVIFSDRCIHSGNIEVIPTAGHTSGGLCFFYPSPYGLSYLFTGDTLFSSNGRFETILITSDGADREKLKTSLSILRGIKPDVILSSASSGNPSVVEVTNKDWIKEIDDNLIRLSSTK